MLKLAKRLGIVITAASAMVAAAFLSGCSASQPSTGDGKQVILDRIESESEGRIKLVSFLKTNGQKGELAGVPLYSMEFESVIEFTEDCQWVAESFGMRRGFKTRPLGTGQNMISALGPNPGAHVSKGERQKVSGAIAFEQTEKGWRASRVEITAVKPLETAGGRASNSGPSESSRDAKLNLTRHRLADLLIAVDSFEVDCGFYPKESDGGLKALVVRPTSARAGDWRGPYVRDDKKFKDAWGREFLYDSTTLPYRLWSIGPDGKSGTKDDVK